MDYLLLKAEKFNPAIIGVDMEHKRIVYDKQAMVDILVDEGMDTDEAIEFLQFNVWCGYLGEYTPIFIDLMDLDEIEELIK